MDLRQRAIKAHQAEQERVAREAKEATRRSLEHTLNASKNGLVRLAQELLDLDLASTPVELFIYPEGESVAYAVAQADGLLITYDPGDDYGRDRLRVLPLQTKPWPHPNKWWCVDNLARLGEYLEEHARPPIQPPERVDLSRFK